MTLIEPMIGLMPNRRTESVGIAIDAPTSVPRRHQQPEAEVVDFVHTPCRAPVCSGIIQFGKSAKAGTINPRIVVNWSNNSELGPSLNSSGRMPIGSTPPTMNIGS